MSFIHRIPTAKIATILGIAALVSTGMCGLGAVGASRRTGMMAHASGLLISLGVVIFWLSILGLIVTFILWLIAAIFEPKPSEVIRLMETKKDDNKNPLV